MAYGGSTSSLPHWAASLALVAAAISGCATGPTASQRISATGIPLQWQSSSSPAGRDEDSLARWWHQFNDATLDELIAEALQGSPDIRTAISTVREARALYGSERANLFPSVVATVYGQGSKGQDRQTELVTRTESYGASLDAGWEVDLFGRERYAVSATYAQYLQSEENYRNVQATLAAEVAAAYVAFRSYEAQITVLEQSIETRSETLQLAEWREKAGLASALDTQQSVSALEQARASLPSLRQSLDQLRNTLALLCGKRPGELDSQLSAQRDVPRAADDLAVGIPADTIRQRPDIRAAERALEAAVARTHSAQRARFPSLSLSGSIGIEALRAGDLRSPNQTVSTVLANLTAPIFNAGQIRAQIDIQREQEEQAFLGYEATVLNALSEVENALIAQRRNEERIAALDRAIHAAREAATLAGQQYQAGQVDMLTVLDAQRTLLSVEQQRATTLADLANAHIQLYKAAGGGWARS